MGLIGGLGGGVDRRRWGLGRSTMGLGVGRRVGSVEQVGGEGAGRRAEG